MTEKTLRDEEAEREPRASQPLGPLLFRLLCARDLSLPPARFRLQRFSAATAGRAKSIEARVVDRELHLGLADAYASTKHLRLEREGTLWFACDEGSTNGTVVDGERLKNNERRLLRDGSLIEAGRTFFLFRSGSSGPALLPEVLDLLTAPPPRTINPEWELDLHKIEQYAKGGQELLILGETGSGKEVLARFIHERSGLAGPMVSLNCGALPEALQEDELFGHTKGAFSGATADRPGLIRAAEGGVLFLDEIGDMPPSLQVKLLRVLEERKVRPLGGEQEFPVQVRVISATHRDLEGMVDDHRFRADLFARLGLLQVRVPGLRERREDVALFIHSFLGEKPGTTFEMEALRAIFRWDWPLNVRELRKVITAAAALAEGAAVSLEHLPAALRAPRPEPRPTQLSQEDQLLRARLVELLAAHHGNVSAVAREWDKARTQIRRWMQRFGLN